MASNTEIPQTPNPEWGFFGTISDHADAVTAWPLAINAISNATSLPAAAVAAFLDSRHGRHFADEVSNHIAAGQALAPRSTRPRRPGWDGASAPAPPTKSASPAGSPT